MNLCFRKPAVLGAAAAAAVGGGLAAAVAVAPHTPPRIEEIQRAYEREAATASARHSKSLTIRSAKCAADQDSSLLCWVQYTEGAEPTSQIQFDVVVLSRTSLGWRLESGLCKQ